MIVWVGLLLLVLLTLASTANLAIRDYSHARLTELLEKRNRGGAVEWLTQNEWQWAIATAVLRTCSQLAFVLVVAEEFNIRFVSDWWTRFAATFMTTLVLSLIFAVAIPNAWARHAGDPFLALTIRPLRWIVWVLSPFASFLRLFDSLTRRLAGVPKDSDQTTADQLEQDLMDAVSEGEILGAFDEEEREMIESVIELRETSVGEIMTPRTEVIAIESKTTLAEIKTLIQTEGHSRIPVYSENIDDIRGVLYAKDLLYVDEASFDAAVIMRKVPFIPETKLLKELLHDFKQSKVHIAIVLDEYGGTAGLVTIEDIIEELVGDIIDEYEPPEPESIEQVDEHTWDVDARLYIYELNDKLKADLPEDEDYETIGGFVFSSLGKIPQVGEAFNHKNLRISVLDAEERKINRLRVEVLSEEPRAEVTS